MPLDAHPRWITGQQDSVQNARLDVLRPLRGQTGRRSSCHDGFHVKAGEPNRNTRRLRSLRSPGGVLSSLAYYNHPVILRRLSFWTIRGLAAEEIPASRGSSRYVVGNGDGWPS